MVQRPKGLWIYPARRWVEGCLRAYLGGGACWPVRPQRRPAGELRHRARATGQDFGGQPAGCLNSAAVPGRRPIPEGTMLKHKYAAGDRVIAVADRLNSNI